MDGVPDNFIEVFLRTTDKAQVVGFVEDVVLNLHAEGKIKHMPILTVDGGRLVVEYWPTDDFMELKAYPNAEQLRAAMPDDSDADFDRVLAASGRLAQTIPVVPLAGDPDANRDE